MSLDLALEALPAVVVDDDTTSARVLNGVPVPLKEVRWEEGAEAERYVAGQTVRLKTREGRLVALATMPAGGVGSSVSGESSQPVLPIVKVLVEQ